jgi:hypothetical protein
MTKVAMLCPFSKGRCIECAVFRGRHYGLCFKTRYEARDDEVTKTKAYAARKLDTKWEVPPEFVLGGGCIRDIEDWDLDNLEKKAG